MKTLTIPQKMSNSGSIHDIASDQYDRVIRFRKPTRFAVVLASYYGDHYTTHATEEATAGAVRRQGDFSLSILDTEGNMYDIRHEYNGDTLEKSGCRID